MQAFVKVYDSEVLLSKVHNVTLALGNLAYSVLKLLFCYMVLLIRLLDASKFLIHY